jgi:transposase
VRSRARFHPDNTRWQLGEVCKHLPPPETPLLDDSSVCIDTVNLKNVLGQIEADGRNLHGGWLLLVTCDSHQLGTGVSGGGHPPHQIQALDRRQPGLPMKKGRAGTMTHDYKRNGTTTLFAALNVLDGTVIGRNMQRHRHQEFIRFLNTVEAEVPVGKIIHVILDNYGAHKHPKVRAWLDRHPRFVFHFVPTSCSWLNAVEGFFAKLTRRRLKRGVFRSLVELHAAINRFIEETNQAPRPFTWTADPDKIVAAVRRGHQVLDSIH